ncbi:MAG TPA: hypothetical protein VFB22_03705 [Candidatus Baltobacteraceae bacterium]|nr:hypothetical protein [Candidatus Baltobacteraceae bacterium]
MDTRKGFLAAGAAVAWTAGAASALAGAGAPAAAGAQGGAIIDEASFVARIRDRARHRQAIGAVRVNDGAVLQFAVNSLNGFESGWGETPAAVHIAIVLAGSAVTIALDDEAWQHHHLADVVHGVANEFLSLKAPGNPFAHVNSALGPNADKSVPALQLRGVAFFACNTALGDVANRVMAAGNGGDAPNATALQAHLRTHVLPGVTVVPAGISALAVLQENGYSYYSAAL